jgi:hypothetical protein
VSEYVIPFIYVIKEDEMVERIECMWKLRYVFKILVGKPEEKKR